MLAAPTDDMVATHTILLVEDNLADVKITQRAVREGKLPVDLVVARDGEEALDYLLHRGAFADAIDWRPPHLVLLDINLPRMSGLELLKQVRGSPHGRLAPVVVLTTSRRVEDVERMYAAGANTYIEKPREFHKFVEVLRTIHTYWLALALLPPQPD